MRYTQYLKAELKGSWMFFAVFMLVGIGLDLLVYQRQVDWGQRVQLALVATVVFIFLSAWQKMRKAR